jgi:hypothetical protein
MAHSGGRYVVTAVEGNKLHVESWNDPNIKDVVEFSAIPPDWPEVKPGLQLLCTVHKTWLRWMPAKRQIKDRFIPISSKGKK